MLPLLSALLVLILSSPLMAFQARQQQPLPFDIAMRQAQSGQFPAAIATLNAAIKANPKAGENVYLLLSQCELSVNAPQDAVTALRAGLKAYPAAPLVERALGELLFHMKYDSSEAGTLLAHAAKILTTDPEAKHFYAQWAYLNARDRICVQEENEAVVLPGLTDLALLQMYTLLGMCESRLEEPDSARAAFQKADEVNARQPAYDPGTAFQYIQFLTRYNDEATAQKIIDEVLTRNPGFGPAHLEKAKYYDQSGLPDKAVTEAKLALASSGNDANTERAAHGLLARCYNALGRTAEAEAEQNWISSHPNPETPSN